MFFTIFPCLAICSEPLCATYASFGGGGSHILNNATSSQKHLLVLDIHNLFKSISILSINTLGMEKN